jgi:xyloglucan-specific exo-beta-1,4-glucanase
MSNVSIITRLRSALFPAICLIAGFGIIMKIGWPGNSTHAQSSQTYSWRNVTINGGGYVPGIVFNTKEPNLIYARTDIGGAYRWDEATESWIPLMDFINRNDWNLTGVDTLATDPVEPNRLYVQGGTYTNEWTSQNGAIYRSTDRGNTFQRTDLPFKAGGNMPGRSMGERLAIDPNRNSILYLGARSGNGLWRSTDYGATWSKVNSFPNPGNYSESPDSTYTSDNQGVVWVTFDPRTGAPGDPTRTIYVGVADKATSIYRSTDAGSTWEAVPGQPTGFLPHHGVLASTGMLYISYSDGGGPYDGEKGDLWKYDTATATWTNISPVPSSSSDNYFGYGGLTVDAQHPDVIMVAALNSWWPDTIFFRSLNGGATWTRIWDWADYPNRTLRYIQDISASPWLRFNTEDMLPEVSPKLGWMVSALEIDPFNSDRLMYGTGATIYGTNNLTDWDSGRPINIKVMVQGLEETAVLDIISPPTGAHLLSAMRDITGFRHDDLGVAPARMYDNPRDTPINLDYAERRSNFIVRVGEGSANHIAFSFDGGNTWMPASTEPAGANGGGTVAAAADASRVVWSPAGAAVSFSTDNGGSWTASAGIPAGARVISDRVNRMKFYGLVNGMFYVSTNGGANFTATAAAGLPGFARFKATPGREGDIWLAGGGSGLWHSVDSGATFTRLVDFQEAAVIGFGKAAPRRRYPALYTLAQIDGIQGIFRSDDAGASWIQINDDRHQFGTSGETITGDPRVYGRVYIGTNGRGIIQGDNHGPNGGCSVTPVVYANTPWYNEQVIRLDNGGGVDITALSVSINIQRTGGLNHTGQYNNVGGGQILQSRSSTATTMIYQFTLAPGQTLRAGSNFAFAAQTGGSGTMHPMSGDTYIVSYKAGGTSYTLTGHF